MDTQQMTILQNVCWCFTKNSKGWGAHYELEWGIFEIFIIEKMSECEWWLLFLYLFKLVSIWVTEQN